MVEWPTKVLASQLTVVALFQLLCHCHLHAGVFSEDPGSAKAFNAEEMEEANAFELQRAKAKGLCRSGDFVAALHQVKDASMIKILIVK